MKLSQFLRKLFPCVISLELKSVCAVLSKECHFCQFSYRVWRVDLYNLTSKLSGNALGIWICGCRCILESSGSQNSGCTQYQKPQNQRVQKVMSQRSAGLCTRCTRVNAFPDFPKVALVLPNFQINNLLLDRIKSKRTFVLGAPMLVQKNCQANDFPYGGKLQAI